MSDNADATAVVRFREAAEQGISDAQGMLGLMLITGRGVPQDRVEAFKWLSLAAAQGNNKARQAKELTARKLTPAQITEAERLARDWKPKK